MRVFVAGATGVIGQHLVPGLTAAGHEVTASTRSALKANEKAKRELGWTPKHASCRDGFPAWAEPFKSGKAA